MTSARKFVYTIGADYEGESEFKKLQADLKAIGQIDSFEKLQLSWKKTNEEFVKAKTRLRELRVAMKNSGGKEIERDYKAAAAQVKKLSDSLARQKGKLDATRIALKESGIAASGLAVAYKKLKSAAGDQGAVLAAQMKLGVRSIKSVHSEIDGLNRAYKTLKDSGTRSMKDLALAKDRLREKVADLRRSTNGWSAQLSKVKQGWVGLLATAGSVAAVARGIKFFAGFDDSMREVQAVSSATGEEMVKLTKFARDLGTSTRFTATEIAQGMAELAQSGMSTEEIFSTLPTVIDLTSASGMQFKQTADLLTDTLKQFGLENAEAGRVADVIAKGYTSAGHSAQQLGAALSYVAPVAKGMGYEIEQTVAIVNALAEAGYKGQRGGTALRGGFVRLIKPTGEAADVLEKYKIQIYDSEGAIRDFADIIADLGDAALSQKEKFILFGQEAGPGMISLLDDSGAKIKEYQNLLEDVGGTAKKIAGTKESGLGGALRSLTSSLQAIVIAFGDSLAPAVQAAAQLLTGFARIVADLPKPILQGVAAIGAMVTGMAAWHLGLKHIFSAFRIAGAQILELVAKNYALSTSMNVAAISAKGLAVSLGSVTIAAAAAYAGYALGGKIAEWEYMRDVVDANKDALGEVPGKLAAISKATGLTIKSFDDLDKAQNKGLIRYDRVTGEWVKGAGKISTAVKKSAKSQETDTKQALEKMKAAYKKYADTVKRLQDDIAGREKSLAEQLREMDRSGMSESKAWNDRKDQAEEFAEAARKAEKAAKAAFEAGDVKTGKEKYKEAVANFDKARDAAAELNTEIREGDNVIQTQQQSLKESRILVEEYGVAGVAAQKNFMEEIKQTATALNEQSGGKLAEDLPEIAKVFGELKVQATDLNVKSQEFKAGWQDAWAEFLKDGGTKIDKLENKLRILTKDRNITVRVKTVEEKTKGGLIGPRLEMAIGGLVNMRNMLAGGHFPGFGGGDRRHVVAEDGEVMIRKESVRTAGLRAALAFNVGRWDVVVSELMKRFDLTGAIRRQVGGIVNSVSVMPVVPSIMPQRLAAGGQVSVGAAVPAGDTFNMTAHFSGQVSAMDRQTARNNVRMMFSEMQKMHRGAS